MQPNFSNRNTNSNLIKSSAVAGKKARRRLIGSVFMLLVALIILLNVTARTKPIPVNPKVIEIKRNASNITTATHITASSAVAAATASAPIISANQNASATVIGARSASQVIVSQTANASSAVNQVAVTNNNTESATTEAYKLDIPLKIVTETTKPALSPEDILNGKTTPNKPINIYFIQLITSANKQTVVDIKAELIKKEIKSNIQPIKTDDGITYRLRVGPFKTKTLADKRLKEIQKAI